MEADEILRKAWEAVEKAGVPESLQEAAFREAVDILRAEGSGQADVKAPAPAKRSTRSRKSPTAIAKEVVAEPQVDEATFFSHLANESGVPEEDLRDILHLTADGKVHVTPPTRKLGVSVSEQARTVIALVASGRSVGLRESPAKADEVRDEMKRKRCYDSTNFAGAHLGPMKGFNAGSNRTEIVLTSKWIEEFKTAVDQAHGRRQAAEES